MLQGIYIITNLVNDKCYIGQSVEIEKRWRSHINTSKNKKRDEYNYPLYHAFRKYGLENFKFEILELVPDKEILTIKEEYYFNKIKPEYCLIKPRETPSVLSKKSVHKIDIETLEILETYESIAQASKLNGVNDGDIGRVCNRKHITSKGFYWVYVSDYSKDWKPKERNPKKIKRKVLQFDSQGNFIKSYESMKQAGRENKIYASNIGRSCRGKNRKTGGYIWRFADEK